MGKMNGQCTVLDLKSLIVRGGGGQLAQILGRYVPRLEGELQRHNKLISSQRPFKILQNETKIIKIGQAVLEIFNFKY